MTIHPRFAKTYCSQCGRDLGPGDSGVSHCDQHRDRQRREIGVDPGCYALAESFLIDDWRTKTLTPSEFRFHVRAMAEDIQAAIENYTLPEPSEETNVQRR